MKDLPEPRLGSPWPETFVLIASLGLLVALVSCRQKPAPENSVVPNTLASVGDRIITTDEFQAELARRSQHGSLNDSESDPRQSVLEDMIRFEAVYQKAIQMGYDRNPQLTASFKRMIVAKFQEDQLGKAEAVAVSEGDIQVYYQTNPARFGAPEMRRGAALFLSVPHTASPDKKAELLSRIEELRAQALTNHASRFGALAINHSEDQATRYQGGDMGWLQASAANERWEQPVIRALFALKTSGDISPAVATTRGYYLVKLVETKAASMRPLAEVKEGVHYLLTQQKQKDLREEFAATQKASLPIEINRELLAAIPLPEVTTRAARVRPPKTPGL